MLDAELAQLPGGEARSLQQRAGLVGDDVREGAPVAQRPDHAERGPPAQAGEGAGVAVRVHLQRARPALLDQERGAPLAQALADLDRGLAHGQGGRLHRVGAVRDHGRHREHLAAQVDRGRAGVGDPLDLGLQPGGVPALALGLPDRERYAERAGHPQQRRAPHRERRIASTSWSTVVRWRMLSRCGRAVWSMAMMWPSRQPITSSRTSLPTRRRYTGGSRCCSPTPARRS